MKKMIKKVIVNAYYVVAGALIYVCFFRYKEPKNKRLSFIGACKWAYEGLKKEKL